MSATQSQASKATTASSSPDAPAAAPTGLDASLSAAFFPIVDPALAVPAAEIINALPRPSLTGDELKALVAQMEFIFSKEYLASDPNLVSQLNGDFLPISAVAELPVVRLLTTDLELVKTALKSSEKIVVDEAKNMARPSVKLVQRNTIIIRDIPESTPHDQIRSLFGDYAKNIAEMKPDIESTFFVKLDSEEITTKAFLHLRQQKFNNAPVQARVKSENILRSFSYFPPNPAALPLAYPFVDPRNVAPFPAPGLGRAPFQPFVPSGSAQQPYFEYPSQRNQSQQQFDASGKPIDRKPRGPYNKNQQRSNNSSSGAGGNGGNNDRRRGPNYNRDGQQRGRQDAQSADGAPSSSGNSPNRGSDRRGNQRGARDNNVAQSVNKKPEGPTVKRAQDTPITPASFPPLSGAATGGRKKRKPSYGHKKGGHEVAARAADAPADPIDASKKASTGDDAPLIAEKANEETSDKSPSTESKADGADSRKTSEPSKVAAVAAAQAASTSHPVGLSATSAPFVAPTAGDAWSHVSSTVKKPPTSPQTAAKMKPAEPAEPKPKAKKDEEASVEPKTPPGSTSPQRDAPASSSDDGKKDDSEHKAAAPSWADKARTQKQNEKKLSNSGDIKLPSTASATPAAAAPTATPATATAPTDGEKK